MHMQRCGSLRVGGLLRAARPLIGLCVAMVIVTGTDNRTFSAANAPLRISGWAVDPRRNRLAAAVMVTVGQKTYPARYGEERPDVASYLKNPSLSACGFAVDIPRDAIAKGTHEVSLRVVTDGHETFAPGVPIKFDAR